MGAPPEATPTKSAIEQLYDSQRSNKIVRRFYLVNVTFEEHVVRASGVNHLQRVCGAENLVATDDRELALAAYAKLLDKSEEKRR